MEEGTHLSPGIGGKTRGVRSVGKVMACSNAAAQQAATHRDQPPKE